MLDSSTKELFQKIPNWYAQESLKDLFECFDAAVVLRNQANAEGPESVKEGLIKFGRDLTTLDANLHELGIGLIQFLQKHGTRDDFYPSLGGVMFELASLIATFAECSQLAGEVVKAIEGERITPEEVVNQLSLAKMKLASQVLRLEIAERLVGMPTDSRGGDVGGPDDD